MEIRELSADERPEISLPIQAYAFQASPADDRLAETLRNNQQYYAGNVTLVAEEDGVPLADASAIPMRQNVRGIVFPMAGIAGVATLPLARRRGYARALVTQLLGQMRDAGHVLSPVSVPAVVLPAFRLCRAAKDADGPVSARVPHGSDACRTAG